MMSVSQALKVKKKIKIFSVQNEIDWDWMNLNAPYFQSQNSCEWIENFATNFACKFPHVYQRLNSIEVQLRARAVWMYKTGLKHQASERYGGNDWNTLAQCAGVDCSLNVQLLRTMWANRSAWWKRLCKWQPLSQSPIYIHQVPSQNERNVNFSTDRKIMLRSKKTIGNYLHHFRSVHVRIVEISHRFVWYQQQGGIKEANTMNRGQIARTAFQTEESLWIFP